ncbi:uncharacterized protein LOC119112756 isoform X1 [Pollicipes pollicipes]|uniref:uncharacterized protein LOC119112756 isoform X1 n=1 Tax=Pollicipes pollicipes TaxID=41117 RepID=UPI001884E3D9|nr:uncharacterized protein LOC119112756 isoform X1 [Pollicipes pollicipes]
MGGVRCMFTATRLITGFRTPLVLAPTFNKRTASAPLLTPPAANHATASGGPADSAVSQITYGPVEEARQDEIVDIFVQHFFPDETLSKLGRACDGGELENQRAWLRPSLSGWDWSVCLVATDSATSRVVGASLNTVITPTSESSLATWERQDTEAYQWLGKFFSQLNGGYDIFKALDVETVLERIMATVDKRYRGQGIASELFRRTTMELAPKAGCQAAVVAASSPYTRQGLSRLGYTVVNTLRYRDSVLAACPKIDWSQCEAHDGAALMVRRIG